jgi:hypothetical protein
MNGNRTLLILLILAIGLLLIAIAVIFLSGNHETGIVQSTDIQVVSAACVAIFTAFVAIFTYLLVGVSRDQVRLTTVIERPFVFVDSFDTYVIGNELRILPKWRNSGATATREMENWVNWKIFPPTGPPTDYTFPDLDKDGNPLATRGSGIKFFLGPNDSAFGEAAMIPLARIEDVRSGRSRLFVWGWTEYTDMFDKSHVTKFCNEVVVTDLGKDATGKVSIGLYFAKRGQNTAN